MHVSEARRPRARTFGDRDFSDLPPPLGGGPLEEDPDGQAHSRAPPRNGPQAAATLAIGLSSKVLPRGRRPAIKAVLRAHLCQMPAGDTTVGPGLLTVQSICPKSKFLRAFGTVAPTAHELVTG
jgi:hypothetical protein